MTTTGPSALTAPSPAQAVPPARVLFVDDEPQLLAGLRRSLHSERDRWETTFVTSGAEALELLDRSPVEAVVSDMRMPGMDGAQLLGEVKRLYPSTVRIILSGQADRHSVLAALRSTQQFLSKPCETSRLVETVNRALEVRRKLEDPALRALVGGVDSLPALPAVHDRLLAAMDSPDTDLSAVAAILAADVATSTEVLKLVNSAFFGLPREVMSVEEAVGLLGLNNIHALVLAGVVFQSRSVPVADVAALRDLALRRVAIARAVSGAERWPQLEANLSVLTCMLRDVGALILAENLPEPTARLAALVRSDPDGAGSERRSELEREVYGCTVPQVSAHLLGLWGFAPAAVHMIAGQPVAGPGPGSSRGELLLAFAHRRALAPRQEVPPAADEADPERLATWNALTGEAS